MGFPVNHSFVLSYQNVRTYTRRFGQKLAKLAIALKKDRVTPAKGAPFGGVCFERPFKFLMLARKGGLGLSITLEDLLPGPKLKIDTDPSRGDFELFMDRCVPGLGLAALGDCWPDAL